MVDLICRFVECDRMSLRTANPLLVSFAEGSFQLSVPIEEIAELVREGELIAVRFHGRDLLTYESLVGFTRRLRRQKARSSNVLESSV